MFSLSTQLHSLAGMKVKVKFEGEEERFISIDSINQHEQDIVAAVTPHWDESGMYRATCAVGAEELSLEQYVGDNEPDVMNSDGWEKLNTIIDMKLDPGDPPESVEEADS